MTPHLTPELLDFIRDWLPNGPARVLEVGCGDGCLTRRLARGGYDAIGIDPEAPAGAQFARTTLEEFRTGAQFDAAVAIRSLHHLRDPGRALDNLQALIRDGGRLVAFEFAVEHVDDDARRWLDRHGLRDPVAETAVGEIIPLGELRARLGRRFRLLAEEPAAYLAREAGREDLVSEEEAAVGGGALKPAGFRLVYERVGLEDSNQ